MKELILKIVDDTDFFEIQPEHAKNIVVGFARMEGYPVGIVANQPLVLAGCLDIKSSIKAARFVRFCDAFNIPILTLRRRARFHAGHGAGIRRDHQAWCQAAVRLRRSDRAQDHVDHAQGLWWRVRRDGLEASCAATSIIAWPSAEIAVMGPKGAVEIIFRKDRDDRRRIEELTEEYRVKFANPFIAGRRGFIDDVIMPRHTRKRICRSLAMLREQETGESVAETWQYSAVGSLSTETTRAECEQCSRKS